MLNEGKRFRHLDLGIFLTPDPLEYVDGFNPYIYCNQNPWGKWDPLGLSEITLHFYEEGVGINDPNSGAAPAGYQSVGSEFSTNIVAKGTGFEPNQIYTLASDMNLFSKNSDSGKEISSRSEREVNYFQATSDENGNIDFGKIGNVGQDDGNPNNFVNFKKGEKTEISASIEVSVGKGSIQDHLINTRDKGSIKDFKGVKDGKAVYDNDRPSGSIFGPQHAHTNAESSRDENRIKGTINGIHYAEDSSVASAKGKINVQHVGGSNQASVKTSGISGRISNREGRTNVKIKHEKE